jgi:hypothetical protein
MSSEGSGEAPADAHEQRPSRQGTANPGTETAAEGPETGEVGGPKGPEPTRFGDWERKGRCIDF